MRNASDIDWLGRHGRTIAEERRPESRTQTGRPLLVKGRREFTQVLSQGLYTSRSWANRAFLNVLEAQLGPPALLSATPAEEEVFDQSGGSQKQDNDDEQANQAHAPHHPATHHVVHHGSSPHSAGRPNRRRYFLTNSFQAPAFD